MKYSRSLSKIGKVRDWVTDVLTDPKGMFDTADFNIKLKLRSMNNPIFAKKVEDIFLPSNVVIVSLVLLAAYIFILGPGAQPTFFTVLWFLVFSSWSFVVMELIRRNVDDPSKHNITSLRVTIVSLIIPLMLMQTIGLPKILIFGVVTFLIMSPVVYAIRSKWKISGHMCTYTAITTIMSLVNGWFVALYLIIPVISWSRIKLKAHTAAQVFVGTLLGFIVPYTFAILMPLF